MIKRNEQSSFPGFKKMKHKLFCVCTLSFFTFLFLIFTFSENTPTLDPLDSMAQPSLMRQRLLRLTLKVVFSSPKVEP